MNIYETRRSNLTKHIDDADEFGAVAAFAKKYNLDATYVRQILNNHRKMGEKAARKFEETLKIKRGSLEINEPQGKYQFNQLSDAALSVAAAFEASSPELQEAALRMLGVVRDIDNGAHEE